jgi:phosphate/sulfate permease
VARTILIAWVVTLPATAFAGALAWAVLSTVGVR